MKKYVLQLPKREIGDYDWSDEDEKRVLSQFEAWLDNPSLVIVLPPGVTLQVIEVDDPSPCVSTADFVKAITPKHSMK